jgi:hypothetical protein
MIAGIKRNVSLTGMRNEAPTEMKRTKMMITLRASRLPLVSEGTKSGNARPYRRNLPYSLKMMNSVQPNHKREHLQCTISHHTLLRTLAKWSLHEN